MCVHNTSECEVNVIGQGDELPMYHHWLAKIVCNPTHSRCYLAECDACLEIEMLKEEVFTHFDEIDVEQIVYKQWVSTDRSIYIGDILFIS